MEFDFIKCPIHHQTFKVKKIKKWVEENCSGKVLNLFAGYTKLDVDEIRNDIDTKAIAHYYKDALEFVEFAVGKFVFETIILDPPYSYRKSMEYYHGKLNSRFKVVKDILPQLLSKNGVVVTFGYQSVSMGTNRGFIVERVAVFSHGGATHDTIATKERYIK